MDWKTLELRRHGAVACLLFNRPQQANALDAVLWRELREAMEWCDRTPEVRAVVLAGNGKHFCAGLDLTMLTSLSSELEDKCEARLREKLHALIVALQTSVNSLEACRKPVIAAVHGACVGGGLDIALAADIRYASQDARFSVREVAMGMVADVGSLQRLPRVVGEGLAREWAYTGRDIPAEEARNARLVSRILPDQESVLAAALETAQTIASRSPLAVRGTKQVLNYSRDHGVQEGLAFVAQWNAAMLLSEDLEKAAIATLTGEAPVFRD
ncbi:crotonase/enoyl-CoA hydratase family protein [Crenobacter cavernae]|uniref:Crotonase/enoyl-CoA hydratase family protein n=1 Tax=Crenobacter cavernae TaxID=2290923 RepID=A0ABY0FAY2_9NEIS|nr:crotonase/enoyl-CoA hydratase family protein [Crenobacter cavernae]RXZ42741.1 crotonase/enoyl-CoA hydratase family protein [Crenobacter cavernae]